MRSQEEILERMEKMENIDVFAFGRIALVRFLDYENAKPWLKKSIDSDKWKPETNPIESIKGYMSFAIEKAIGERGISAYRSLMKMKQWAWVSGDEELMNLIDPENYENYGIDQLVRVCKYLDIEHELWWIE